MKSANPNMYGSVDTETMYTNVMEKFKWGGMDQEEKIYMDENNLRMTNNLRLQFANLAEQLIKEEKVDKARLILDKAVAVMPNHNVPFDRLMVPIIDNYYKIGANAEANALTDIVFDRYADEFEYFLSTDTDKAIKLRQDIQMSFAVIQRLHQFVTRQYPQEDIKDRIDERFQQLDAAFDMKIQEMEMLNATPLRNF